MTPNLTKYQDFLVRAPWLDQEFFSTYLIIIHMKNVIDMVQKWISRITLQVFETNIWNYCNRLTNIKTVQHIEMKIQSI